MISFFTSGETVWAGLRAADFFELERREEVLLRERDDLDEVRGMRFLFH
jgi:hypothetical protein